MIYINGKFLVQRKTGVQQFATELTRQLIASGLDITIVVPKTFKSVDAGIPDGMIAKTGIFSNLILWEQVDLFAYVKRNKKGLLLSFCNTGPLFIKNQVVCIHDMAFYKNPQWFSKLFYKYYMFLVPRLARSVLHIITVSNFSKHEISEKLRLSTQNITIINNAPAAKYIVKEFDKINLQKDDFFLFVGSYDPRKNIQLLLKVFSLKEYSSLKLVIIGAPSKSFVKEEYTVPVNIEFITNCDDDTLAGYYRRARALINSSVYEGFGLPIIEAMASGCPLIISEIPPFVEIARKNACYFNPHSIGSLKIALNRFLGKDGEQIIKDVQANYIRSFDFSWKVAADDLSALIKKIS